ncbi:MAG TPA: hypothetical protein DD458_01245 [Prolixibacteraceae bacterium]|nr:hypothetical protein [Prolixibacteraceae bacterium]HCU63238.1 hypothetical protein [Prolixibacteraceae bacterium]
MAVQKEIWMSSLVEQLFANNSFMSKAFNADEFVTNKTCHIPNAGVASNVEKNRKSFPATVKTRADVDLTFDLDEYTTDPIKIPHADTVELSYNKRESVLKNDKAKLIEEVSNDFIYKWSAPSSSVIRTTGTGATAHLPSATGNRKKFVKADVLAAMNDFNSKDIPQEGRYMLVDAVMYGQLINDLTDKDSMAFYSQADVANGVLGKLFTFNIMMRSKSGRYTAALAPKAWTETGVTTDQAAVLAWHEGSVCRALGQTEMFDDEKNPLYYGDIYSFLVRAGGRPMRNDVAGLLAIVQDNA